MIGRKKILNTLCSVFFALPCLQGQVRINEVLANNQGSFDDATILLNDWIELYNASNVEVDLGGMGISDSDSIKHVFPKSSLKIPPKGYLVLLASGNGSVGLRHLNFSLSRDGETLKLFSSEGKVIDKFKYPTLRKDVAFGRKFDGAQRVRFFDKPSPGASNDEQSPIKKITKAPKFSKNGGFNSTSFSLKISRFLSNADIYYTLDGSEPSPDNAAGMKYEFKKNYQENPGDPIVNQKFSDQKQSFLYDTPLQITDASKVANRYSLIPTTFSRSATYLPKVIIPKASVVRAIAIKKGKLPSEVVSNTYFFDPTSKTPYTFPIVSLAFNPDDLFDYQKGIYVAGNTFDTFRKTSFESTGLCTPGNYSNHSSFWEKDASFEFFEQSSQKIRQAITARVHGGCSRSFPYKSFKLFSNDSFGSYDLIRSEKTNNQASIVLRNSGNDYNKTLFKDAFIHQMVKTMKIPIQEFRPSIVYINGEYWGIHNLRDRVDNDYLNKVYGVDKSNVDMIKIVFDGPEEVEYGDNRAFNELKTFFRSNNFSEITNFEKAQSLVDIDNFIDFQIAHIFVGNIDWPQNNVRLWRVKTDKIKTAPADGKWRWVLFDADRSLGETVNFSHNNLSDAINSPANFIFSKLLQNQEFKSKFVSRFMELLDKNFKYENSSKIYLDIKKLYEPEIEMHLKRWNIIASKAQWEQNCQEVLEYLKQRPEVIKNQLKLQFGVEYKQVQVLNPFSAEISIDGESENLTVTKYVETEKSLKIKPFNTENKKFSHWVIGGKWFFETEIDLKIVSDTTIVAFYETTNQENRAKSIADFEEQPNDLFKISRGLSLNNDLKNEHLELALFEGSELEYFRVFDKNGLEKPINIYEANESGKVKIGLQNQNNLKKGTYFYVLKLKNNPKIFSDFLTVEF